MNKFIRLIFSLLIILISSNLVLAQAPVISYSTPQTYTAGTTITPLAPVNTGGAVPGVLYAQSSLLATFSTEYAIYLVEDAQGNFYHGDGNAYVYKTNSAGVTSIFAGNGTAGAVNGKGTDASFNNPQGMAMDAGGNIYVADEANNLIRKISPEGLVSTFAGSGAAGSGIGTGTAASFNEPNGLAFDKSGNLYVSSDGDNLIRKITPAGVVSTLAGSGSAGSGNGTGTAASFNNPLGIATDASGNIYVADEGNQLIREITPAGVVSTFAGNSGNAGLVNGTGTAATFSNPTDIAIDALGNLYVCEGNNYDVRKITPAGVVSSFAGGGNTSGTDDGTGTTASFLSLTGITIDASANLYIVSNNRALIKISTTGYSFSPMLPDGLSFDATTGTISGTPLSAIASTSYAISAYNTAGLSTAVLNLSVTGSISPAAPAVSAPVISYAGPQSYPVGTAITALAPSNTGGAVPGVTYAQTTLYTTQANQGNIGMVMDASNNLYYCAGNTIYKIGANGISNVFAGSTTAGLTNGAGSTATFNSPNGLAIDAGGNIYVADNNNNAIRKITPAGVVTTLAGNGATGNNDGTGTMATFYNPIGLAADSYGNIYVADYGNNMIRRVSATGVVTTIAGNGQYAITNGTGALASFAAPIDIAIDGYGNLYVDESSGSDIRKITPAGVVSTFAGSGSAGFVNGTGTAASFSNPGGMVIDAAGNLYLADYSNSVIRKITPAAVVTTLAGGGSTGYTGTGATASFLTPYGVAIDASGNLYVNSIATAYISKVTTMGYSISPLLPAGLFFDATTGTVTGTPLAAATAATYTITAYNAGGSSAATVSIAATGSITPVTPSVKAPVISYASPQTYPAGTAIATLAPSNTGGAVPGQFYSLASMYIPGSLGNNTLGIVIDASNNLYYCSGTSVYKVGTTGSPYIFAGSGATGFTNGTGAGATFSTLAGLAIDASGNIYVADNGNNAIRKITPAGIVTTIAGNGTAGHNDGTGTVATFNSPNGIAMDAFGNLAVTESGNSDIRRISPAGVVTTLAGGTGGNTNGTGTAASFSNPEGIAIDGSGNMYVADFYNNLIRKITPAGVVTTLAGSGNSANTNGTGTAASFNNPQGIAVDPAGNVYVADFTNQLLRKITPAAVVTTLAGGGPNGTSATGTDFNFGGQLNGLAIDASGNLYTNVGTNIDKVTSTGYTISPALPAGLVFNPLTGSISGTPTVATAATAYTVNAYNGGGTSSAVINITVTGTATAPATVAAPVISYTTPQSYVSGTAITALAPVNTGGAVPADIYRQVSTFAGNSAGGWVDGPGLNAAFNSPSAMATDAFGNIYVADNGNYVIRKISPAGVVSTFAGNGRYSLVNGTGTAAGFSTIQSLAVDNSGNIYVADVGNYVIRKITAAGVVTTFAGSGSAGSSNGAGAAASFGNDFSLAVNTATGYVYVADPQNNLIRQVTPSGNVTTFAGSGSSGNSNGTGTAASFFYPTAIAINASGSLFVTDQNNSLIRKINSGQLVSTFAGGGSGSGQDGTGTGASFNFPVAITIDAAGNLYVADTYNYAIREITPAAVVTTIAGYGGNTNQVVNGIGAAAAFTSLVGIAADRTGDVFITESSDNTIRELTVAGYVVSSGTLPAGLALASTTGAITGTPTAPQAAATCTITAYNGGGSSSAAISFAVTGSVISPTVVQAPAISYQTPQSYTAGTALTTLLPANTGGAVPAQIYSQVTTLESDNISSILGVAVDAAGNIYTSSQNNNVIFKTSPSGVTSIFAGNSGFSSGSANGAGNTASFNNPKGIAIDAAGNLYVADYINNMIRKITPNGIVSTLAGSTTAGSMNGTGTGASFNGPYGVAVDPSGNVFVADANNNMIRMITPAGAVSTLAGSTTPGSGNGTGIAASFNSPQGLTVDANDNVYVSDYNNNLIRKITSAGVVSTIAGTGSAGNLNGSGTAASFNNPIGIVIDAAGNLYIADTGNVLIREISPAGVVSTLAGSGNYGSTDGTGFNSSFNSPSGLVLGSSGTLYVGDTGNNSVRLVNLSGYTITPALPAGIAFNGTTGAISGTPELASPAANYTVTAYNAGGSSSAILNITVTGSITPPALTVAAPNISYTGPQTYTVGTAISALSPVNTGGAVPASIYSQVTTVNGLSSSSDVAVATDAAGNIYAAFSTNQIEKINSSGVASLFAGTTYTGNANGTGASASFSNINGLATDASGNVYVADGGNNLIRKITPAGVVTTLAGSGVAGRDDGEATNSSFNNPMAVALDNYGNVYVADYGNNAIRKISPSGVVITLAGGFSSGFTNGMGAAALFNGPAGLATDGYGNVYVADYSNNAIREVTAAGVVTTLAGSSAGSGNSNGTGAAASFFSPRGITIDATGNLYVADYSNALVRKITPAGVVTTLAGSGVDNFVNGTGTEASFYQPYTVAIDASGNLELGEAYTIEKISLAGYTISPALPTGLTFDATTGIIGGTPEGAAAAANYTIAAYNAGGSSTATLNITTTGTITPPAPSVAAPNISYTSPAGYSAGVTITSLAPVNTGGAVPAGIFTQVGPGQAQPALAQYGSVATDPAGNLYTLAPGNTQVLKITPAGAVSVFAGSSVSGYLDGPGISASFSAIYGLAADGSANIYVADAGNNVIRKITPAGVVSTLAGSGVSGRDDGTGTNASFNSPHGLAVDNFGYVYVADYSNNIIRKISPSGIVTTLAGSGSTGLVNGAGAAASFSGPYGLALDGYANIYVADFNNNVIREITPAGVVTTVAGNASGTQGSSNGTGTAASFYNPAGIAVDATGNLYVADQGNSLIRKITPLALVTTVTGGGSSLSGIGTEVYVGNPWAINIDPSGNVYIASQNESLLKLNVFGYTINTTLPAGLTFDSTTGIISGTPLAAFASANYTVTAYNLGGSSTATVTLSCTGTATAPALPTAPVISYASPQTYAVGIPITALPPTNTGGAVPPGVYGTVSTFAGSGANGLNNGTGAAASFSNITQMATDIYGNLYVADAGNYVIRKITPAGVVTILAGSGSFGDTNGTGTAASFGSINGITVDASSNVYISDGAYNMIRKITPAGVVTTLAGNGTIGFVNGSGVAASFANPSGIVAVGSNIFVCDLTNYVIRKITAAGVVSTFAGNGSSGTTNGASTAASFYYPQLITADKSGNLYVSDYYYTIRKVTPGGGVSSFAGVFATTGSDDGTGTAATFNSIGGLTTDAAGNLYVSDGNNDLIRKITSAGVVTTIAGSYSSGFVNGVGNSASFNNPGGIAADASGNLYIADVGNYLVRDLIINGYTINSDLPFGLTINGATGIITGTPTVATSATSYTVTANNAGGSATAAISITVRNPPVVTTTTTVTAFASMGDVTPVPVTVDAGVQVTDASLTTLASGTVSITGNFTGSQDVLAFTNNPSTMGNIAGTYTSSTGILALTSSGGTATTAQWQAAFESVTYNNTNNVNPVTASRIVSFAVNDGTFGSNVATKTVSITYTPSHNATLSGLSVSQGTLSPAFASATTSYSFSVGNSITSLTVTPVTASSNATVTVNGTTVISGSASAAIPLTVGSNTVTVTVTAQDNVTVGTYTLTVIRQAIQTITFASTNTASYGTPDFNPGATSTNSTIPITYTSSNTAVATISVAGNIHIISAGTTTIMASQAGNAYYAAATPVSQTLTITQAALTVIATNESKTYGTANPTLAVTYSGFVNNDTQTSLTTQPTITTTATASSPAGNYPITASGAADANYTISYVAGTLTVGQASLTITATNATKVYGAAMPTLAVTYSGFVNGDTQTSLTTQPTITSTASASSPVGTYSITASGAADANYSISYSGGTLTVTPASLTITATSLSKTYGSANPTLAVTYTGLVNGDTKTSLTTQPNITTTATASSPAGTYPITASGAADANYTISYVAGTLTVQKAALTITATNESKIYGAANPTLAVTFSGFVNGDSQTSLTTQPTITTTATASSAAGSYPITASAAADANYTIGYVAGTLTVQQAPLTITATNESKLYGAALPTLAVTFSGFVNGDSQTSLTTQPTISTTATASSPAGTYPITASAAVDANYAISYVGGTLTVNPAPLTITATNETKTYGAANPTLAVTYNGLVNGDTQTSLTTQPTIATTASASSPVGTYPITASGAVDANYTISYVAGTLTVQQAALTITATNESKIYGAANPTLAVTYSGFVNGDSQTSLTTQPTITTTATSSSPAGTYPITASGAADANYTISYVAGTLTVQKAALTITATNLSKVYGAANPTLAVTYSGFVNGDSQTSLTTQPTIATTATASSAAGTYPITASGAVDANYTISYVAGTLTVGQAALTITATSESKTYGAANPTLAVTYSGFVNGDSQTSLTTQPTITTTATASSAAGSYPITASAAADANYTISYVAGTLKVNPAALTITATNESKTYGAANPTLAVTYSGFVNGDTQTSLTTQPTIATTATAASPAGTYPITASAAVDANYTISYVAGTLTVGQAALTITATNESKTYGAANPTLAVTYSGFVNGDSQTSLTTQPTIATTATASSPAGKYPITASGAVDANYTISYVAGTLIVGQAALTITATNENKIYGAANPTLAVTYSGFVNGDTQSSLTTQPTITTTAAASSAAGTYPITASGAAATNYTISYVAGTLTVGQAALTITATNESKTYGTANPTLAVTYSGFVNGDTQSSVTTQPTIATTATASSPAGAYPITASGAAAANYTISYTAGTLTVGQAALTITATNESKSYGAAIPTLPATYSGFVNGDTQASLTTQPTITTTATAASPTGTYPITASSAVDANYAITYAAGTLTITPVALTITANNQTKSLGTANPALTATYTGFVNGDTQASLTTQPTITTTATNSSPVGSYPITASAATDPNYTISYAAGTLSVTTSTSDAYLNNLTLTTATLSPAFTFSTLTYTASVANATASITETPTVSEAGSTITVNGTAVTSGSASGAIALTVGANTITTIVTAPNGTNTETYTVTVTRAPATNAKLSYLGLSQVTLSPAFATATTSYTASVANTIATTNVEPIEVGPGATIAVNGVAVASGATTPVALSVGATTINTVVTAQDGVTQITYTVVVTRAAASVATLNNLTVSGATLSPTFATTTTSYTATVGNAVTSITITPTTTASNATVTVNGTAVTSGSASGAITLSVGANTITTVVTAGNGTTTDTYTTTVTRTPASNAKLSYLGLSQVTLSPAFASTTTSYTASVANTISSTNVEPIEIGPGATIAVNGVAVASGATTPVTLSVGTNTINTVVTAQDGVTKITYTVTVTRAPSAIATLSNITLNSGTLSPAFASTKTSYTASVGNTLTSITETPTTTDPTATVTVNGTAVTSGSPSGAIALSVGANTITTVITAGNGTTTDTYTVTVTRAPSSNAKLSYLGLSKVTLSPTFATATTSYTASVANSITSTNVEGITVDPTATIAVNGVAVASGSTTPVALNVGANTINTVVTAQDGVTQITYAVTVTRAAPAGAYVVYDPISVEKPADSPQLEDDGIVVHQGVSPNGDGIDDVLTIDGITNYPDNKLTIINRSGMLIYDTKGYDNSSRVFDGHSNKNGQMQLPGTYFYSLDYTVGNIIKHRTGYIVLKY